MVQWPDMLGLVQSEVSPGLTWGCFTHSEKEPGPTMHEPGLEEERDCQASCEHRGWAWEGQAIEGTMLSYVFGEHELSYKGYTYTDRKLKVTAPGGQHAPR